MKEAVPFLSAFGRALSVLTLYSENHPARNAVEVEMLEELGKLQEVDPTPSFTFLDGETIVNRMPVPEVRGWGWAARLSRAGMQRIEVLGPVRVDDIHALLDAAVAHLSGKAGGRVDEEAEGDLLPYRPNMVGDAIRYGRVGLREGRLGEGEFDSIDTATLDFTLDDELEAVMWLQGEMKEGRGLHVVEVEAVVRSLAVAAVGDAGALSPLIRVGRGNGFAAAHAMNVSILSMALAEFVGMDSRAVRAVGTSGLLHDLGNTRVPSDILKKPGELTQAEHVIVRRHPEDGARLILASEDRLELAAVVAYEHHVRYDGAGYPNFRYRRPVHPISRLVQICDIFDTLMSPRPWRPAWSEESALTHIADEAGKAFDPELAPAFVRMIRLERRL